MMDTTPPCVSVVMPVYNAGRYLHEAVESILNQTFRDFEFIIIDDGSTDRSLAILERYAAQDERIRLISRENRGLAATLNEGIDLAHAPYIARMDADDISLPERFEKQYAFMEKHPGVVSLGTQYDLIDSKGRLLMTYDGHPQNDQEIQERLLMGDVVLCHPTVVFRADSARAIGGYDCSYRSGQDLDMWLRLGEHGKLANLPDVLVRYRDHEQTISTSNHKTQVENIRRACEAAWARRGVSSPFINKGWRPVTRSQRSAQFRRWGWVGYMRGDRGMALEYALKALATGVFVLEAWRLMVCIFVKRQPSRRNGL